MAFYNIYRNIYSNYSTLVLMKSQSTPKYKYTKHNINRDIQLALI